MGHNTETETLHRDTHRDRDITQRQRDGTYHGDRDITQRQRDGT